MSEYWSQDNAIVADIPVTVAGATGTTTSDVVDLGNFGRVAFLVQSGLVTTTGAATVTVYEGSATGTVTTALTTLTIAANQDNKQWIVEVHDTALTQGNRYVKADIAVTTATGYFSLLGVADLARRGPASDNDLSTVASITVV
jgi:hypothetical protein